MSRRTETEKKIDDKDYIELLEAQLDFYESEYYRLLEIIGDLLEERQEDNTHQDD